MAGYSSETTRELVKAFVKGEVSEAEVRSRLRQMGVPESGIDTLISDTSQMRAAFQSSTQGSGSSFSIGLLVVLLVIAAAVGYYLFLR